MKTLVLTVWTIAIVLMAIIGLLSIQQRIDDHLQMMKLGTLHAQQEGR